MLRGYAQGRAELARQDHPDAPLRLSDPQLSRSGASATFSAASASSDVATGRQHRTSPSSSSAPPTRRSSSSLRPAVPARPSPPSRRAPIGLDQQVLARLVTEAALDQQATASASPSRMTTIARAILEDPNFRGPDGQFDRAAFEQTSCATTASPRAEFVREQRGVHLRRATRRGDRGRRAPSAGDARGASTATATNAARRPISCCRSRLAGDIPRPDRRAAAELLTTSTRSPVPRARIPQVVTARDHAADARRSRKQCRTPMRAPRYEQEKGALRRRRSAATIQQIAFPTQEEAEAASERKIKDGASFEDDRDRAQRRRCRPRTRHLHQGRDRSIRLSPTPPSRAQRAPSARRCRAASAPCSCGHADRARERRALRGGGRPR